MHTNGYEFKGGFPTPETIQKAYDDADLNRAIEAYKFFYPVVSWSAGFFAAEKMGLKVNGDVGLMIGNPRQLVFTPNSDTPYGMALLDLSVGPIVVELPPGPLISVVNDLNQRYVMDLGLPGPDAGKGGKHVIVPPGDTGQLPPGHFVGHSTTNRVMLAFRAIPQNGDVPGAIELMKRAKVYPLGRIEGFKDIKWIDLAGREFDMSSASFERTLGFWELLHNVIDTEPPYEPYRGEYGELATLGIAKGKLFAPDERMNRILAEAAVVANDQMRVQAFADRRPDRVVWKDRKWEWASLRPESGTFDTPTYSDLEAREKWFYQAILESPAMFRRDPGAGSLYWLGTRDKGGAFLDGSKTYKLDVPQPVPAKLFWSVTIYDPETRGEIKTDQDKAALRSLVELKNANGGAAELYFGPSAPEGAEERWIKTIPGKGWFTYFRIYGPDKPAFDSSWKPGDFEEVRAA